MPYNLENRLPRRLWDELLWFKTRLDWGIQRTGELLGLSVARTKDYYSPLPSVCNLRMNRKRWDRPGSMPGIPFDLEAMKLFLSHDLSRYWGEFGQILPYSELQKLGFGPGYNSIDALALFGMIRHLQPRRYLEIGSGLSTFYCQKAAERNQAENRPLQITCVEPFPYPALNCMPGIQIIQSEVQSLPFDLFEQLEPCDILFIDSSHVLKIDGDVAFLYLEIIPRLKPGVWIHIHDIPFPYNTPYPAQYWIFDRGWPKFWSEAMLVQAFLTFNPHFEIQLSLPLLRHFEEEFLKRTLPFYETIRKNPNTFSSLWLKRIS